MDARSTLRRRFVTLTALRWLSSGLLVPVFVVLLKARDLSVSQVGVIFAVYTGVAAVLEVPTGGLADTWGRRPTLLTGRFIIRRADFFAHRSHHRHRRRHRARGG